MTVSVHGDGTAVLDGARPEPEPGLDGHHLHRGRPRVVHPDRRLRQRLVRPGLAGPGTTIHPRPGPPAGGQRGPRRLGRHPGGQPRPHPLASGAGDAASGPPTGPAGQGERPERGAEVAPPSGGPSAHVDSGGRPGHAAALSSLPQRGSRPPWSGPPASPSWVVWWPRRSWPRWPGWPSVRAPAGTPGGPEPGRGGGRRRGPARPDGRGHGPTAVTTASCPTSTGRPTSGGQLLAWVAVCLLAADGLVQWVRRRDARAGRDEEDSPTEPEAAGDAGPDAGDGGRPRSRRESDESATGPPGSSRPAGLCRRRRRRSGPASRRTGPPPPGDRVLEAQGRLLHDEVAQAGRDDREAQNAEEERPELEVEERDSGPPRGSGRSTSRARGRCRRR